MADYSNSVETIGSQFPTGAVDGQEWLRVGPIITPSYLRSQFLTGIPLVSFFPHPVTRKKRRNYG